MINLSKVLLILIAYAGLLLAGVLVAIFVQRDVFEVRTNTRFVEATLPIVPEVRTIAITGEDAHQQRMLEELADIVEWAGPHKIFISEMGVPYNKDVEKYKSLIAKFFQAANATQMHVTSWAVGEDWGDYPIAPHIPSTLADNALSSTFTGNLSTKNYFRGTNLAGAEFGLDPDARGEIGEPGENHTYHEASGLWQQIASKGYTHVRYPFRLERLFNVQTGTVDPVHGALLLQAMESARIAGLKVVLDPHNYAALQVNGKTHVLGSGDFPLVLYQAMLTNLTELIIGYEDTIEVIGLMNEPKNLRAQVWETFAQAGLDALRDAGWKGEIEVPTGKWQGAKDVTSIHPKPWITDPEDNFMYGVHQYYDELEEGSYEKTYAADEKKIGRKYKPRPVEFRVLE